MYFAIGACTGYHLDLESTDSGFAEQVMHKSGGAGGYIQRPRVPYTTLSMRIMQTFISIEAAA